MEASEAENKKLIKSINLSKKINYGKDIYENIWEKQDIPDSIKDSKIRVKSFKEVIEPLYTAKSTICIITDDTISNEFINTLLEISKKKIRIYLIIKEPGEESKKILSRIVGKILIRTSKLVSGNVILVDPDLENSQGLITNSPLIDFKKYDDKFSKMVLNSTQITEAFEFFKVFFWHHTEHEILKDQDLNIFRSVLPSKFPKTSLKLSQFLVEFEEQREIMNTIIKLISQAEKFLEIISENFIFPKEIYSILDEKLNDFKGEFTIPHTLLKVFKKNLSQIDFSKTKLFGSQFIFHNFIVSVNEGEKNALVLLNKFQLNEKSVQFGIKLDPNQYLLLEDFFSHIKKKREFCYYHRKKLKDIKNDILLINKNDLESVNIEDSVDVDIGDLESETFDEFLNQKPVPNFEFNKKKFHKNVNYQWVLNPPTLPELARRDFLYDKWDKEVEKINQVLKISAKKIEWISNQIDNNEDKSLKSYFLGKEQRLQEIHSVLGKLKDVELRDLELD
jgi:hypothetical protein